MGEKEARDKLSIIAREQLPNTLTNISTAVLIWLFGALVFLPAAYRIAPRELPLACSLILLTGFSIFVFRAFGGLRLLLDATSDVLARISGKSRSLTGICHNLLKSVLYGELLLLFL